MKFKDYGFGSRYEDAHLSKVNLPNEYCEKILEWEKKQKGLLIFSGTPGTGKTYLACALLNEWLEKKYNIRALNERTFFNSIRDVMKQNWDYEGEIRRISDGCHFILDDIGSGQITEWQKEVLFSFVDTRLNNQQPTLITSNIFINEMGKIYGERFASRIKHKENVIIEYIGPDKRQE